MDSFTRPAIENELHNIADWWIANTCDAENGGFFGEVDFKGETLNHANKGIILNSRILWFFSELCLFSPNSNYRTMADRAFNYLLDNFDDEEHGGAIWELDYTGKKINGKKQTYAQCFCIYAFSAYYRVSENTIALDKAFDYFHLLEEKAKDHEQGGYLDAFSQEWEAIDDFRLSDKDLNSPKTMNTHLHVLEAYSALHKLAPNDKTQAALTHVLQIFNQHIIDHDKNHLRLFFDMQWNDQSLTYSYGHDIEACWLLWEAVEILDDKSLIASFRSVVTNIADACLHEGIGDMGQLCDEFTFANEKRSSESIWWVQAEAMVGFLRAFQLTGKEDYRMASERLWTFICQNHIDLKAGEWHWLGNDPEIDNSQHYKVGFWKAPYHNGRAMMEVHKLLSELT